MKLFSIREPIWKTRSVGLNQRELYDEKIIFVDILYKNKEGKRIYPNRLTMESEKVRSYPTQIVKGVVLHIIPISDFELVV